MFENWGGHIGFPGGLQYREAACRAGRKIVQCADKITGDPHRLLFIFVRKLLRMGHDGEPRQDP